MLTVKATFIFYFSCSNFLSLIFRFALTLRFLATGDSYTSLQYLFRVSKQSIGQIIPEVCAALIQELREHVKVIGG